MKRLATPAMKPILSSRGTERMGVFEDERFDERRIRRDRRKEYV